MVLPMVGTAFQPAIGRFPDGGHLRAIIGHFGPSICCIYTRFVLMYLRTLRGASSPGLFTIPRFGWSDRPAAVTPRTAVAARQWSARAEVSVAFFSKGSTYEQTAQSGARRFGPEVQSAPAQTYYRESKHCRSPADQASPGPVGRSVGWRHAGSGFQRRLERFCRRCRRGTTIAPSPRHR